MKKLYYVRHGLSKANVDKIWSGQSETKLTKEGIKQSINRGKAIKEQGIRIDLIISSPLGRTMHTAQLIAQEIGYPKENIMTNKLFLERSYGVLENKPVSDFSGKESYERLYKNMDKVENAESLKDLQKRAQEALEYLHSLTEENILVVSHGTFGRALRRSINSEPHTHEYTHGIVRLNNAELYELI